MEDDDGNAQLDDGGVCGVRDGFTMIIFIADCSSKMVKYIYWLKLKSKMEIIETK